MRLRCSVSALLWAMIGPSGCEDSNLGSAEDSHSDDSDDPDAGGHESSDVGEDSGEGGSDGSSEGGVGSGTGGSDDGETGDGSSTDGGTDGDDGTGSDESGTDDDSGTDEGTGTDETGTDDAGTDDTGTDDGADTGDGGDGDPPDPDCTVGSVVPDSPKSIVAYYTAWSIYDRAYEVEDIPADKVTHINYAFANLSSSGECVLGDPWADVDRVIGSPTDGEFQGNFGALVRLREENPHLKTLISVGGWTWSDHFSSAASTSESRAAMASSCIAFMRQYQFDGIDLDWEYPVSGGEPGNETSPEDKHNYTLLLQEFRRQLDEAESEDQAQYLLTIAAPAGPDIIENYEVELIHEFLDWINIMAYDFHGSWSETTNFNAPLYPNPMDPTDGAEGLSVDSAVTTYLARGAPRHKIVVGVPFYGRGWHGVSGGQDGLYDPFTGVPMGTWEAGVFDYHDIVANYLPGYTRFFHEESMVPWLYDANQGIMISYDDTESMACKANYIAWHDLAGAMFWELSGDLRTGDGLLEVLNDVLR